MRSGILALLCLTVLLLGSASAAYSLCDSVERGSDENQVKLTCNMTTAKFNFTQKSIDGFWLDIEEDNDYLNGGLDIVEWRIKSIVLQVTDNVRFIQPKGMNVNWDLVLVGDSNTIYDFNHAAAAITRPANQTAIKKSIGAMQDFLISFAPVGTQRSVRNITLEKLAGALAVYIQGGTIKKAEFDIEGTLSLSGAYIENSSLLRAKNINLQNGSYISGIDSIEAENISLEGTSYLRNVGSFGKTAINLENSSSGLILKGKSYIDGLSGGIETNADIYLEGESRIENISRIQSEAIQWIYADSLTLKGNSTIKGMGGKPGEINIVNGFLLENSKIFAKQGNKPSLVSASSISMTGDSTISGFLKSISVAGRETFLMSSGATIENFSGTIDSCATLSMDGNTTKIIFAADSEKTVKAKDLNINNGAAIQCIGEKDCNYTFVQQTCRPMPTTRLDVSGALSGSTPFRVNFFGECKAEGTAVNCIIDFGDGSKKETFDGNATHFYTKTGSFKAILTATTAENKTAESERKITVKQATGPAGAPAQASLSTQTAQQGGKISIAVQCDSAVESVSIESDLGLVPAANFPQPCPATFGPFTIPESATVGTHTIVVNTKTINSQVSSQELSIAIEQKPLIAWLPFELDKFMPYAIAGAAILAIAAIMLLIIMKRKKEQGIPKSIGEKARTKRDNEATQPAKEQGKAQPKENKEEYRPPWMQNETEEDYSGRMPWQAAEPPAKEAGPVSANKPAETGKTRTGEETQPKQDTTQKPAQEAQPKQAITEETPAKQAEEKTNNTPKQDTGKTREHTIQNNTAKHWWQKTKTEKKPETMQAEKQKTPTPEKQAAQKSITVTATQKKTVEQKTAPTKTEQKQGIISRLIKKKKKTEQEKQETENELQWNRTSTKEEIFKNLAAITKSGKTKEEEQTIQSIMDMIRDRDATATKEQVPKKPGEINGGKSTERHWWQKTKEKTETNFGKNKQVAAEKMPIQLYQPKQEAARVEEQNLQSLEETIKNKGIAKSKEQAIQNITETAEATEQALEKLAEMVRGKDLGESWLQKPKTEKKPETMQAEKQKTPTPEKQAAQKSITVTATQKKTVEQKTAPTKTEQKQGIISRLIKKKKKTEQEKQETENELPTWLRKGK